MYKRKLLIFLTVIFLGGCAGAGKPDLARWQALSALEPFKQNERVLILAPHPDDEAIGCAGVIQQALKAGAKVKVIYLTNGDHNELAFIVYEKRITIRQSEFVHMGQVRRQEAIKAMKFLGLSEDDLVFLGYPDFGTFAIFCRYWQNKKPFRDKLTRISSVPYKDNPSFGAPYQGTSILSDLVKQILDYKPNKIFVSHPADVNGDHKALYLFLQVALSDLEGKIPRPKVYPYLIHCVGWPKLHHYHPELELYPPDKFRDSRINWVSLNLTPDELDKKYRATLYYKSQTQSSAFYLFSFSRKNELFGDYPQVELKGQSSMFKVSDSLENVKIENSPEKQGQVRYAEANNYFLLRVDNSGKINRNFGMLLYLFGYSRSTTFADMPKIRIITSGNKYKVFDGDRRVFAAGVLFDFKRNYLVLKIPFKLLGEPDYIFSSLKAYHGTLPIDALGFRKIKIK